MQKTADLTAEAIIVEHGKAMSRRQNGKGEMMLPRSIRTPMLFAMAASCGLVFATTVQADPPSETLLKPAVAPSSHASVGLVRSPPGGVKSNQPLTMRHVRKKAALKGVGPASGKSPAASQ
jgi:hypothetical protein